MSLSVETYSEESLNEKISNEDTSKQECTKGESSVCDGADFLAIDVETANSNPASICAVGLVYFKGGQVSREMKFLIDPEDHFQRINSSIHGIRSENISGAPTMREMYPLIASTLATTVVVHHTHFDRTALCRVAEKYGFPAPSCAWLDSAYVVRQTWKRFSKHGYGLDNLAAEFGIAFNHHDPCEDARAAGLVLVRAMTESGLSLRELLNRYELPVLPREVPIAANPVAMPRIAAFCVPAC